MQRNKNLKQLQSEHFDICIIGGGASGAGVALDAALRGYKVALIEADDFASETSSKSTKLIHGGVRYLEQAFKNFDFAQLKQVRHGLEERHTVLSNAPHLARPLPLVTPVFSWFEGFYFTIGLTIYSWFAKNDSLPGSKWLSRKDTFDRIPTLNKKTHSSVLYYDGQLDDARYCLAIIQSADAAGAVVINHASVTGFEKNTEGKLTSAQIQDNLTKFSFSVKSKLFINCTGAFADTIRRTANADLEKRIRPSKGSHLVLPHHVLNSDSAMLIPKTHDGRVVFAIPFENTLMVGTTDTDSDNTQEEPVLEHAEINFLIETLERYLEKPISRDTVQAGFAGLRPLIAASTAQSTKKLVRDHEVETDTQSGLISLLGGKWTTYRLMAKDTVDVVDNILTGKIGVCKTEKYILFGGDKINDGFIQMCNEKFGLNETIAAHLISKYGSHADKVLITAKENPLWSKILMPDYPILKAEVIYAAREEMALTVRDFLARRTRLEIADWRAASEAASVVAILMGEVLGWSNEKIDKEIADYHALIEAFFKHTKI